MNPNEKLFIFIFPILYRIWKLGQKIGLNNNVKLEKNVSKSRLEEIATMSIVPQVDMTKKSKTVVKYQFTLVNLTKNMDLYPKVRNPK